MVCLFEDTHGGVIITAAATTVVVNKQENSILQIKHAFKIVIKWIITSQK